MREEDAFLGLGSNVGGDGEAPRLQVERALEELQARSVRLVLRSSLYRTEPVGGPPQPWFVNAVVGVRFEGEPLDLLHRCQAIESLHGRRRVVANGPRTLDIDVLLCGEALVRSPELTLPHPRLGERRFVLVPMVEIAPDVRHPESGRTMRELLELCRDRSSVVALAPDAAGAARA